MTIRRRLIAGLASIAIAASPVLRAPIPLVAPMAGGVVLAGFVAHDAAARAGGGRSSGGYSRPSVRTPSFSSRPSAPRTPSTSGGYARPSAPSSAQPSFRSTAPSAGDQALSRQRAADALGQQRALEQQRQQAPRPSAQPRQAPAGGSWWGGTDRRTPSTAPPPPPRTGGWFAQQGWSAPPYAAAAPRSFGVWDGLFLWFMLDNLTKPGYSDWFGRNRNDPGVQQWRQQADAMAQDNADLRRKLAELDSRAAPSRCRPASPRSTRSRCAPPRRSRLPAGPGWAARCSPWPWWPAPAVSPT